MNGSAMKQFLHGVNKVLSSNEYVKRMSKDIVSNGRSYLTRTGLLITSSKHLSTIQTLLTKFLMIT